MLTTLFSTFAFASCLNLISPVEAQKAIAGEPSAGSVKCEPSKEKCLCFDGIDLSVAELVDGKIQENKDKKKAKADALKAEEDKQAQRKALVRELKQKAKDNTLTAQDEKQILKLLLEQLK